jgi:glycerate kinase
VATATARVLVAPDKLRGTATATEVADAVARAAGTLGLGVDRCPMADGGEGTLEALGGPDRTTTATGPLGAPVDVPWRCADGTAVIEVARVAGLLLAGGAEENDPERATTAGVGELLVAARDAGARRAVVALGGSATTDGGEGALEVVLAGGGLGQLELVVACDVRTRFLDAPRVFGPQKGAGPATVTRLERRLAALAERYHDRFGVDVTGLERAGAAGGLAGGLACLGGRLVGGFDLVAAEVHLAARVAAADVVVTAEGRIDAPSFDGKVVGGVAALAAAASRPCTALCGRLAPGTVLPDDLEVVALVDLFGDRAWHDAAGCVEQAAGAVLARWGPPVRPEEGGAPDG